MRTPLVSAYFTGGICVSSADMGQSPDQFARHPDGEACAPQGRRRVSRRRWESLARSSQRKGRRTLVRMLLQVALEGGQKTTSSRRRLTHGELKERTRRKMPLDQPEQLAQMDREVELNDLRMSKESQPLFDAVKKHIEENVAPIAEEFYRLGEGRADRWSWAPGQLELLQTAKDKAKASGLWNFFLPTSEIGRGLTNLDYAYIAAELGKQPLASETLNCSAPDTGNMEVLERVGTPEQKKKWLVPLLNGEIRSAYAMTEPNVASSDAKNVSTRAVLDGDEWVINGEKYYISGAGDPRCKIMIVMVKTSPDASPQFQQSQILVPIGTPGLEIVGPMTVFGHDHAPRGHMHLRFKNCPVPAANILLG